MIVVSEPKPEPLIAIENGVVLTDVTVGAGTTTGVVTAGAVGAVTFTVVLVRAVKPAASVTVKVTV